MKHTTTEERVKHTTTEERVNQATIEEREKHATMEERGKLYSYVILILNYVMNLLTTFTFPNGYHVTMGAELSRLFISYLPAVD